MRLTTTLAAAAALSLSAVAAQAGNPGEAIATPKVMMATPMVEMAPTSSINSGFIVLGLVAALVAASGSF
jgi:hypothetical protein